MSATSHKLRSGIDAKGSKTPSGSGERVVISGMSGIYPESHNVKDLSDILYNKINPVTDSLRWNYSHPEMKHAYIGNVPDINQFDAQFFKVHYRLGQAMDPMGRKLLEHAYQAIYDSTLKVPVKSYIVINMAPILDKLRSGTAETSATTLRGRGPRVVISGMSGSYPESHNVKELSDILYKKINPVTDSVRWNYSHPEIKHTHIGNVPDIDQFDAQFFRVHYRIGQVMDPMARKLLEHAYQAIYDSGINPQQLFGRKVGVYIGTSVLESEKALNYSKKRNNGLGLLASNKSMFANRISYWLNINGPSLAIDEACCSSSCALEQAYNAISKGECEAAIVGGANLSFYPHPLIYFGRLFKLSPDGKTKSFDNNATGLAKSEAIGVLFLQKAKDALRIYADVVHVKCEYTSLLRENTGPKYGFYRNPETTATFIENFYKDVNVSTAEVEYVEAFGSAISDADKAELEALEKVFCKNRREPLPIGCVMSNIGFTEAASGISAVTKVLLGYNCGQLAGNLHFNTPRQDVPALRDGKIRVITEHQKTKGTYIAVNGFSISGINSHILLHGYNKPKDLSRYKSSIPQLICLSGRKPSSVVKIINDLKSRHLDLEELALLRNIHETKMSGHLARGFAILDTNNNNETITLFEKALDFNERKRPLCFVYSGMGSQWAGMGKQLLRIPIFAAAIEKCRCVLEPKGIDIVNIITSPDKKMFDNILNSFVGIAAIQIGLTDILKQLELLPDIIIGHSVGELGCAYADGCFTCEEMILAAYYRGLVSVQTSFIHGSMAAVGIGYREISTFCPPEIDVACRNGPNSCTISGPADIVKEFVSNLTSKKVFAKEVACSNIAYHSRYISKAGPDLLKYLSEVIKSSKPRSERWISTSVPQDTWNDPIAKYSSAEYHTNNLLNSVLFEDMLHLIPSDAVLIEIAPHGLLQAILKRSLPSTCRHIPLTRREHPDSVKLILEAFGNLYIDGYDLHLQKLYPKVEFPVSTGTPMLSHLVKWAHIDKWSQPKYVGAQTQIAAVCNYVLSVHDDDLSYLQGHVIRGKNILPFAAALVMVWDTLAMVSGVHKKELSVQYREVFLFYQPAIYEQQQLRFRVTIQKASGRFEIMTEDIKVATGFITKMDDKHNNFEQGSQSNEEMQLSATDIYELFYLSDYSYCGEFRSIYGSNLPLTKAKMIWRNNWVTLIDGMLQLNALRRYHETVSQPNFIRGISIDVKKHFDNLIVEMGEHEILNAVVSEAHDSTRCGGITMENIKFHDSSLKQITLKQNKLASLTNNSHEKGLQENLTKKKRILLKSSRIGDFNSLHWEETPAPSNQGVSVKVCYAGINNVYLKKDVYEIKKAVQIDFSGVTKSGVRVMGIVQDEAISTHVTVRPEILWPVPKYWSLEEAATVPLAYCLAFYCLYMKGFLRPGYRVLVHGGTGALGQAVISIALANNCEIFTTVSSNKKKQFLLNLFPKLKANYVGMSRDGSFRDMVLTQTRGKGCDIIISCVQGELRNTTLKCCAAMGVTLDTSMLFSREDFYLGMNLLTFSRNYYTVNLATIFDPKNINDLKELQVMLGEGIARGYVRPLSRMVYTPSDVSRAFRLLATSQHRGRILLDLQNHRMVVKPRLNISPECHQILLSNDEIMGIKLAEMLVSGGARKLALVWEEKSNALIFKLRAWGNKGVETDVIEGNIWDALNLKSLLEKITCLRTVESIYYTLSIGQETEIFRKNIEEIASIVRKACPALKNFVVIVNNHNTDRDHLIKKQEQLLTWILLPKLKMKGSVERTINKDSFYLEFPIIEIEKALYSKGSMILANEETPRLSVLQQLCDISDIIVPDKVLEEATLKDLGLNSSKIDIVRVYLRDVHNILLAEDDVLSLTMKAIRRLEEVTLTKSIDIDGISAFYSYVDTDELQATADFLCLPTLRPNAAMVGEFAFQTESYMYLVPGVEGLHSRFHTLCERLKLPVLALQPGVDFSQETLKQMAMRYVKIILEKTVVSSKDKFYLIAYESGVLVALEMAAILENQGIVGKIFCIGGSPEEVKATFIDKLRDYDTVEKLQTAVLQHINKLLANEEKQILDDVLKNASSWKEKIDLFVQTLKFNVTHSTQYMSLLVEALYARLDQVLRYDIKPYRLRSQIIFLHPKSTLNSPVKSSSLQNYSVQPIIEYTLPSTLPYITQDLRCAAIVNRHLGDDVLKEFEQKNICEIYLLHSDEFSCQ